MSQLGQAFMFYTISEWFWPDPSKNAPHLQMGYDLVNIVERIGAVVLTFLYTVNIAKFFVCWMPLLSIAGKKLGICKQSSLQSLYDNYGNL